MSLVCIGECATRGQMPSLPWLMAANIRSLAGMPPTPPDFHSKPVLVSTTPMFTAITAGNAHTCALDIDGKTYAGAPIIDVFFATGCDSHEAISVQRCGTHAATCPVELAGHV